MPWESTTHKNTRRKKVYIDVKIRHSAKSGLKHDI